MELLSPRFKEQLTRNFYDKYSTKVSALEKVATGLYPTLKELVRRGVKPGKRVKFDPKEFLEVKPKTITGRIAPEATVVARPAARKAIPEGLAETVAARRPRQPLQPRLLRDVEDILKERAQQAGTYWRFT